MNGFHVTGVGTGYFGVGEGIRGLCTARVSSQQSSTRWAAPISYHSFFSSSLGL
jgi:hypothetical protein